MTDTLIDEAAAKKPTPAAILKEMETMRSQLVALEGKLGQSQPADMESLREEVHKLQLQLAALDARHATAEIVRENAQKVLSRLEQERKRGGKYKWLIENHRFMSKKTKNSEGKPAVHVFYSDATTERAVLEDFKRRTRVQHDAGERDPFKAVRADELEAPTSL